MADTPAATAGELLPVIEGTVSAVSAVNTALNTLKKGLYSVKVSIKTENPFMPRSCDLTVNI